MAGFSLAEHKHSEVRGHAKKGLWATASVVAIYIFFLMGDEMRPNGAIRWAGKVLIQKAGLEAPSGLLDLTTTLPPTVTITTTTTTATTTPAPTVIYITTTAYLPATTLIFFQLYQHRHLYLSLFSIQTYSSSTLPKITRNTSTEGCKCPAKDN
ncbi:hypothetical protein TWF106_003970 [Orbilia oligospora]|uniref:Uncharacterized protein n=1 Tax=Orbilia oligospora TaxID=2813651 RepID=A0A6G1LSM1_ORBOL|nr:hypothetical protein TWF679_003195 [Orbilia oligospora]KAF3199286.1 hypothetical protein TWF106_003970 [Orbilia oligospora]KAF3202595.1 hypothetical protein TWF191_002911 [Orbilia oligospora]KAF3233171.1 hypothetical protein TWF192_002486 [Orbilia oligospora]